MADTSKAEPLCDWHASHYLKVMLDNFFGAGQFRNEIVWKRTTAHSSAKRFAPVHDVILYYSKTAKTTWNAPREAYEDAYLGVSGRLSGLLYA